MSNSIPRNEAPIGLVIVHGIGNQRPGTLSRRVAKRLADPVESENPEETATTTPIQRITVGDAPVLVREAHWASLSHPDNPPRIRRTLYLFRDLVDTVSWAWYASPPATAIRRLGRGVTPVLSLIGGGIFTLVLIALALVSVLAADQSDAGASVSLVAAGILVALLLPIVLYQMYRILRNIYLRTRHAGQLKCVASVVLWVPIAFAVGTMRLLFLLVSSELLVVFFLVVLVAVALGSIAFLPTRAFAGTGRILGKLRLKGVQRWIHRLGWVTVVMPVHSLLQAVKATGNLVSVLLTERDLVPRTATVLWFFAVYGGFVVLLVFSEVMLVMLLSFAAFYWQFFAGFDWQSAADTRYLVYYAIGFGGYLIVLKGLLPMIDLILDIGNYHLASAAGRRTYHERIEQAVESLLDAGCREIHILAHSLGSVISYDWLVSQRTDGYPVTVLHTIGSPLNKFWYLDHARSARLLDRQGLSRLGGRWTNYWAWSDIVSGVLARYGTDAGGVSNTRLRRLGIVLFSHGHYWKNPVVLAGVRREIERSFRGAVGSSRSPDPSGNSMTSGTSR